MSPALPRVVAGLGAVLVLVGLAVALTSGRDPVTTYTGSYSPLEADDVDAYQSVLTLTYDATIRWTVGQLVGAGLLVAGLLLLTAVGGWVAGRRTARRRSD